MPQTPIVGSSRSTARPHRRWSSSDWRGIWWRSVVRPWRTGWRSTKVKVRGVRRAQTPAIVTWPAGVPVQRGRVPCAGTSPQWRSSAADVELLLEWRDSAMCRQVAQSPVRPCSTSAERTTGGIVVGSVAARVAIATSTWRRQVSQLNQHITSIVYISDTINQLMWWWWRRRWWW